MVSSTTLLAYNDMKDVLSKLQRIVQYNHTPKRACVVMILRENAANNMEMLFIRRALHPLDKWSGHMAFPGGRQEDGETDQECVLRETVEEIGCDLSTQATLVGLLNDTKAADNYSIGVFVYMLHQDYCNMTFVLDPKEVSDVLWIPITYFLGMTRQDHPIHETLPYKYQLFSDMILPTVKKLVATKGNKNNAQSKKSASSWNILKYFDPTMTIHFPCIYLPRKNQETIQTINSKKEKRTSANDFVLWGITLGIVKDFFQQLDHNRNHADDKATKVSSSNYKLQIRVPMSAQMLHMLYQQKPIVRKMLLLTATTTMMAVTTISIGTMLQLVVGTRQQQQQQSSLFCWNVWYPQFLSTTNKT